MGENEGKDLAKNMKQEREEQEKDLAKDMKKEKQEEEKYYTHVNLELSKIVLNDVTIGENQGAYNIYINYKGESVLIATIGEDGKMNPNSSILEDEKYTEEDKKALGNMINLLGLEQEKVNLDKFQEQMKDKKGLTKEELEQEKEQEKEEEEEIKDNEPKEQEEEEELEEKENQKDDDTKREEIAKKYKVNAKQVVRLNIKDEKINEDDTFQRAVEYAKGYEEICVIPGKDIYSWKILGRKKGEKEFDEIEQANKQVHGKNPDVTIKTIQNDKIVEQKPLAIYEIDGKNIMAVVKNEWGEPETLYCRKQEGEQKYWGTVVPELSNKNVRQLGFDERSFMSEKNTSGMDLAKKEDELDKAQDLNDRGVPSKEEGVQVYEIDGNARQNAATRKEEVVNDLMRRDGIVDKLTVPPGFYENKADKVLALLEQNKDMQYEEAIEKVENSGQRDERRIYSRRQ